MATFKQNNIQFTADNATLDSAGKKMTKFGNFNNYDFSDCGDEPGKYPVFPFINAVEIDWNNAKISPTSYINTTGELISYISTNFSTITNSSYTLTLSTGEKFTVKFENNEIKLINGSAPTIVKYKYSINGTQSTDEYSSELSAQNAAIAAIDSISTYSPGTYTIKILKDSTEVTTITHIKAGATVAPLYKYSFPVPSTSPEVSAPEYTSVINAQNAAILKIDTTDRIPSGLYSISTYSYIQSTGSPIEELQTVITHTKVSVTTPPEVKYAYIIFENNIDNNIQKALDSSYYYSSDFKYGSMGVARNLGDIYVSNNLKNTDKFYTRVAASKNMTYVYEGELKEYDYRNTKYIYEISELITPVISTTIAPSVSPTAQSNNQTYGSQVYGAGETSSPAPTTSEGPTEGPTIQPSFVSIEAAKAAAINEIDTDDETYTPGVTFKISIYEFKNETKGTIADIDTYTKAKLVVCKFVFDPNSTIVNEGEIISLQLVPKKSTETIDEYANVKLTIDDGSAAKFFDNSVTDEPISPFNSTIVVQNTDAEYFTLSGTINSNTSTRYTIENNNKKFTINKSSLTFNPGTKSITTAEKEVTFTAATGNLGTVEYQFLSSSPEPPTGLTISGNKLTWTGNINVGEYQFTIRAKDVNNSKVIAFVDKVFKVTVTESASTTPAPAFKYYLGSSDNCVNDTNNPTAINAEYSGYQESSTRPNWTGQTGSQLIKQGETFVTDTLWVVMPTEWFNKLVVKTALDSPISWMYTWNLTPYNNKPYTAAWVKATGDELKYSFVD